MATQVQFRRGTTTQNNAFTGAIGELTYDTQVKTLRLHDGSTAGGGATVINNISAQTLTNKTHSSGSVWNGNVIPLLYGGTGAALTASAGAIAYSGASGLALSAVGSAGQILVSGGASAPSWVSTSSISAGSSTTATTATNIAGGSAGQLVIQSDTNTTTFISAGAAGTFLKSTGASTAPEFAAGQITIGSTATSFGDTSTSLAGVRSITMGNGSHGGATVGTITGTGPWTATLTGISSTTSIQVGQNITATAGTGSLFGGSPTSVLVASIVSGTSITVTVTGGTTPTAGTITSLTTFGFLQVPTGTTAQRPWVPANGMIRYNSTQSTFEGYSSSAWSSLGGVKSVDGFTFIQAETSAGASNGDLDFYAENAGGDGATQVGQWNRTNLKDYTGTLVGTQTTQNVFNATATTVNAFGAATTLAIGNATSATLTLRPGTVVGSNTTQNLYNTVATTLNIGGAATAVNIGAATGTLTLGNATITATNATSLALNGASPAITTTSTTASVFNSTVTTLNIGGAATTLSIGAATGTLTINNANTVITGNLTVNGTTTTVNSTVVNVDDIMIELGAVASPTDTTANGGGITLLGATNKTITWDSTNSNWTSNQDWNIATGKVFKINNTSVLSSTTLGSGVTGSSLTSVGTIGTGVWQGTLIGSTYGGTGVNNGSNTLTLAGNVSHAGAFTQTFTATANTSVTLPTTGTLATLAGSETFTNKTLTSPTMTTPTLGVASATSINKVAITAPATGSTLTIADGKTLTASNTLTFTGTDSSSVAFGAGGTVLYSGGALGTPSSATLTNATGLPVSTGISGLGTGIATFLATPSSANLVAAMTDEAGSGALYFTGGALGTPSSATLTNATGLPVSGITSSTSTALGVGSIELGHASDTTIARSSAGVISVEGVVVPTVSSTNTLTNKTLTAPVIDNIKMGYTTTATAAGTTTLTATSNYYQLFTGTTTQTVVLPVTSTLVTGMSFEIENVSTGNLTVNSSGGNLVVTVLPGTCAHVLCIGTAATTAADWDADFISFSAVTGTGSVVLATSPTLVTPVLGTPQSGTLTNCTFPTLNQNTTGTAAGLSATLVATSGGTGQSSYAVGDILYASTTTALSKLADVATGNALISGGIGIAPSYGKIGLTTHISGTLAVANGGTGVTTSTGTGNAVLSASPTLTGTLAAAAATFSSTVATGALTVTGAITATTTITSYFSDDRLKTRTGNIQNALEKVLSLDGFHYHANETAVALGYDASKQEVGLSAQQVQAVLPEVIAPAPIDPQYMTLHYERVIPLLVEAIKEQQKQIEKLKARLG